MTDLLARRGLRLRDDLLLPWARWITPEFEPKRFDTWFFVALLPQAQTARDVSGEASATTWIQPGGRRRPGDAPADAGDTERTVPVPKRWKIWSQRARRETPPCRSCPRSS